MFRWIKQKFSPPSSPLKEIGEKNLILPTTDQVHYQQMEIIGFLHFTVNTFTDKEWGYGDENPQTFNPTSLDTEQWVCVAQAGGMQELIFTAKHHDGFCLWPSKFTEHSVKNSPYKEGKGDIVREFVDACHKYGMKVGFYLSPWDRNHKDYGKPEYLIYYRNQLKELLTEYGMVNELWLDGANGGDGYYGGAREKRTINRDLYYEWDTIIKLVKELQPGIKIFHNIGPDVRWVGNETGKAEESCWSPILKEKTKIGDPNPPKGKKLREWLNYWFTGDPYGDIWLVPQADVSIRPGWFYHAKENSKVKSAQQLTNLYYTSVGRNAVYLINLPPDRRGLIVEQDAKNLREFKSIIDETFQENLAKGAIISGNGHENHPPQHIVDDKPLESYWRATDNLSPKVLRVDLPHPITFNRILLQEPIQIGQRIAAFRVSAWKENKWVPLTEEKTTTIGYKRLLKTSQEITTSKLKLEILNSVATPCLSNLGIYLASQRE